MRYPLCFMFLFLALISFSPFCAQAQASFRLNANSASILEKPFQQDVAFYHQTQHQIKEQLGEWNFKLMPLRLASSVTLDEQGRYLSALTFFGENGDLYNSATFSYNAAGQLEEVKDQFRYYNEPAIILYEWETGASVPSKSSVSLSGKTRETHTYDYAERRKWQETVVKTEDGSQRIIDWKGDEIQGEKQYDADGNLLNSYQLDYNKQGDLIEIAAETADGAMLLKLTYRYLYDEQGNWIKRLEKDAIHGIYYLTQRQIVYRNLLTAAETQPPVEGVWHGVNRPLVLLMEDDGAFTLVELQEDAMTNGTWQENGWGQATLKMGQDNRMRFRNNFQQGWEFTAELAPGRLMLHRDNDHYEFVADWLKPSPPELLERLTLERWKETIWSSPGKRDPEAIPVALRAAFGSVYPSSPGRFLACLQEGGECGIVDEKGYPLVQFQYDYVSYAYPGYYVANLGDERLLLDSLGRVLLADEYDSIWPERAFDTGVFGTRKDGKRYYYNANTDAFWAIEKEDIKGFNDERWVIRQSQNWVLTDQDFKPITTEHYRSMTVLAHDHFLASADGTYWILNNAGERVTEIPGFRRISKATYGYMTGENKDGLYALIDHDGKILTEAIYDQLILCVRPSQQEEQCDEIVRANAIAKFRKPNGEEGFINGLGFEVKE